MYNTVMETKITRNVSDLEQTERSLLESVLGQKLSENQQIIIQLLSIDEAPGDLAAGTAGTAALPSWCNVYEGLSDEDIASVEDVALERSDLTRPSS